MLDALVTATEKAAPRATPPTTTQWGFWATMLLGAGIAIASIVVQGICGALAFKLARPGWSWRDVAAVPRAIGYDGQAISVALIANAIVCCALIVGAIKLKRGSNVRAYLALRTVPPRTYALWIAGVAVLLVVGDLVSLAFGKPVVPDFARTITASADPVWLFLLATVIAAPVFEEVFFRGFLLSGFAASRLGDKGAIVATAVPWALLHVQYDPHYMTFVLLGGVVLGAARLATGSLLVPIVLHGFCNLGAFAQATFLLR